MDVSIKDIVDSEVVLAVEHPHSVLERLSKNPKWNDALPLLIHDFTLLLRDAFDLKRELGKADDHNDLSYIDQPSIEEHDQNKKHRDWTALVVLARDSWNALAVKDKSKAKTVVLDWWGTPYPIFKRMTFYAAKSNLVFTPNQSLKYLLGSRHWWLWSPETKREMFQLLYAISPHLPSSSLHRLCSAIIKGPPRKMYRKDISKERWNEIKSHGIWHRLTKVSASGATLTRSARSVLNEIRRQYPSWELSEDQRDEFTFWMDSSWRRSDKKKFDTESIPSTPEGIIEWLKSNQKHDIFEEYDIWEKICQDQFEGAQDAIIKLATENIWPIERWNKFLNIASSEKFLKKSWMPVSTVLMGASETVLSELGLAIGPWLKSQADSVALRGFGGFSALCDLLLVPEHKFGISDDSEPVTYSINHPIGHLVEALLSFWYRTKPKYGTRLDKKYREIFTKICDTSIARYRPGRCMLSVHTTSLFRVDPDWTQKSVIPLFSWAKSEEEARYAWEGFLWAPRIYPPLISSLKVDILDTSRHCDQLGRRSEQFADFLTFIALDKGDIFTDSELSDAIQSLPLRELVTSINALNRALEGVGERRANYWNNRIEPFLDSIWPQSQEYKSPEVATAFARLAISANDAFPKALERVKPWVDGSDQKDFIYHQLQETKICSEFPNQALQFLSTVTGDNIQWNANDLRKCLDKIKEVSPDLVKDSKYVRLNNICRRYE